MDNDDNFLPEVYEPKPGKGFSFQCKRALLTFKGHIDKAELLDHCNECVGVKFKFWRAAHETGMKTGQAYEHTHVLIEFGGDRSFKTTNPRRFDIQFEDGEIVHPNLRPIRSDDHWENCLAYIAKEDPDNADLKVALVQPANLTEAIWACSSKAEALKLFCDTPGKAPGIIAIYDAKPRDKLELDPPELPWQLEVLDLLATRPDRRSIWWFFDPIGKTGKTQLARYLINESLAYVVKQVGNGIAFATIIQNALNSGWDGKAIIFDIPRSFSDRESLYECLEACVDGMVTSTKYSGKTHVFAQPHVLVFANFLPRVGSMSRDRWKIHQIRQGDLDLEELEASEVEDIASEASSLSSHPMGDYVEPTADRSLQVPGRDGSGNLKDTGGVNISTPPRAENCASPNKFPEYPPNTGQHSGYRCDNVLTDDQIAEMFGL